MAGGLTLPRSSRAVTTSWLVAFLSSETARQKLVLELDARSTTARPPSMRTATLASTWPHTGMTVSEVTSGGTGSSTGAAGPVRSTVWKEKLVPDAMALPRLSVTAVETVTVTLESDGQ